MATPTKPNRFDTVTDDGPPEINSSSPEFKANTSTGAERAKLNFDAKKHNADYAKMVDPVGDWIRDERWDFDPAKHIVVRDDDSSPGDLDPHGRTLFLFSGQPRTRIVNDIQYEPHFFIRISPDIRYKEDNPKQFDLAHRLFLRAREAYLTIHGEELVSEDQLIYLMTEDVITLRTMNGENGPIVLDVKAPQDRKGRRSNR